MSFEENEEKFYDEHDACFYKLTSPIGRFKYFLYLLLQLVIVAGFALLVLLLVGGPGRTTMAGNIILGTLFVASIAWTTFCITASRLWDILGDKKLAIIWAVVCMLLLFPLKFIGTIIFLIILFWPGKLIK